MHNIARKICFFLINFIPNKQMRHSLRGKASKYFDLAPICQNAIAKKFAFKNGDFKTVAIGSSNGCSMFDPDCVKGPAFNFCLHASDAFMMYEIYRNFLKNSNAENIIVFYRPFTRGSKNLKTRIFKNTFFPLKYILNINYQDEDKKIEKKCKRAIKNYKNKNQNYKGFDPFIKPLTTAIEYDFKPHLKLWERGGETKWIVKIAQECVRDNKKFIFVLSPARKLYKNYFPDFQTIFCDILDEVRSVENFSKIGKIYDLYTTDEFEDDSLWVDPIHANKEGGEVITKALNDKLKQDGIIL